jgi:dolichol-phosphate mannosyltransferase
MKSQPPPAREPLRLLSVVIPARNEAGCIAATVEHLHLELRLQQIPHEIVVVDDGSTDSTWSLLQEITRPHPGMQTDPKPRRARLRPRHYLRLRVT